MSLNLVPVMIAGVGYGVPDKVITNDDLTQLVETSDEWITSRTDNDEVFNNRMKVYLAPLKEIRDFYSSKSLLRNINGERTIEEIVSDMTNLLNTMIKE